MKRLQILLALTAVATALSAQTTTITSTVRSTDGRPVSGAIVNVEGRKATATTDSQGAFTLKVDGTKANISVKAEGFYTKEVPLRYLDKRQKAGIKVITLRPQAEPLYTGKLNNGYSELGRDSRLASTQGVESKDFSERINVGGALRDQAPGLYISQKSGMPNEGTYMNIRGTHTFTADNQPLIVVNGVPYMPSTNVSSLIGGYSRDMLFGFDPKDLRSVTVLKGADAAAYGSLGSNGVVVIETMAATSDNLSTRISFSGQYGFNLNRGSMPTLDAGQYRRYMSEIGLTRYPTMAALTEDYPFLSNTENKFSYLFTDNNDWAKAVSRNAFMTENLFRVEGGDEIAKYNISFGYTNNGGTLRNTKSDRYHTLISADVLASRKVDIFANVGLAYATSKLQNMGMQAEVNPLLAAYRANPMVSAYGKQSDGSPISTYAPYYAWNTNTIPMYAYDNSSNPLAAVNTISSTDKIYDVNTQLGLNIRLDDYLKLTAMANIYYNYTEENLFVPGVTSQTIMPQVYGVGQNKVGNSTLSQSVNTYSLQAAYSRLFGGVHQLNAVLSGRAITRKTELDCSEGYNTANDNYATLGNTTFEKSTTGDNLEWNYLGFNLRADYTYNRLLRAQASLAVDGTSVTGCDASRYGFFPSAGLTAMLANLGTLPRWINRLNVSLEASQTGNSRFSSNFGKKYYVSENVNNLSAIVPAGTANAKLTWEKTRQAELGLDISLWHSAVELQANLFMSKAYDLLLARDISEVYATNYYDNTGEISGRGFELALRLRPVSTKDWTVTLDASISAVKNKITSLGSDRQSIIKYRSYNGDDAEMLLQLDGKPYEFYGLQTAGIYSTQAEADAAGLKNSNGKAYQAGDIRFVDLSGPEGTPDGIIDQYDKTTLGSSRPSAFGALNLAVRYRKLTLDANFGYQTGGHIYNGTRRQLEQMSTFYNQSTAVLNRWQVEGQDATLPRAAYGDPSLNNVFSDRWIEKGDYLKLRSVKLSYAFDRLLSFVRSGNVYVAAENLFCLTDYLGSDPELSYSYDETLRGFDYAKLPLPVTIKVGFNLNF